MTRRFHRMHHLATMLVAGLILACLAGGALPAGTMAAPADFTLAIADVDLSGYPNMTAVLQVGGSAAAASALPQDAFRVQLDGAPLSNAKVEAGAGTPLPTSTILLIDESGSMQGAAITAASNAAKRFISSMRPSDTAAIMAFNEGFRTLHGFSSDQAALQGSLAGLRPQKETSLYDALLHAYSMFATSGPPASQYVVLLSDGGDTRSQATLDEALASARAGDVQVYTVGLKTTEFNSAPLAAIATASGGRYLETSDPAALSALYESLAKELHNQYRLTFTAPSGATRTGAGRLTVTATASGTTAQAERGFLYPATSATVTSASPAASGAGLQAKAGGKAAQPAVAAGPRLITRFVNWSGGAYTIALVASALLFGLFYLAFGIFFPKRNLLAEYRDLLAHRHELEPRASEDDAKPGVGQRFMAKLLRIGGSQHPLQKLLDEAGLKFRASEFALLHLIGLVAVVVLAMVAGAPLVLLLVIAFVVAVLPLVLLDQRGRRRRAAFESQVPDTLSLLASSLRAGQGLEQALNVTVEEAREPTSTEFRRILAQQRLGVSLEDGLRSLADRMRSEAFAWVVMATVIQRQVGGNLAEVYESIAETLRERVKLNREIKALTAEGRVSAVILGLLPVGVAVVFAFVNRQYLSLLYTTLAGWVMVAVSCLLMTVGVLWLRKYTRVDM